MMDDRTAKLECLKLAVAVAPRTAADPAKCVEEIASSFYNHISSGSPATAGLTARAEKPESPGPARKR